VALFRIRYAATYGIDAHLIDVEVDMYPSSNRDFITVGMPDTRREKAGSGSNRLLLIRASAIRAKASPSRR